MQTKPSVLVVDDVEANLHSFEETLKDLNVEITKARSGKEALKILFDKDYSLILLDVQMPEMSGFEVADEIRKDPKNDFTPIVFISAHLQDKEKVRQAYSSGAVDFISKPIEPELLRLKVENHIELYKLREKTHLVNVQKPSILIVDDVEANLHSFEQILKGDDVEITKVNSGMKALRVLEDNVFSMILLDVQMPEMSGFDLAAEIRKYPRNDNTPIVFISAHQQNPEKIMGAYSSYGVLDFILKPVDPQVLKSKVRNYIEVYNLRQKNHIYNSLIELNTDGYWEWNLGTKQGSFFISPNLKNQLGYEKHEFENSLEAWIAALDKKDRELFHQTLQEILTKEIDETSSMELKFADKYKKRVWMICKIKLVKNELGEPYRMVGFMTNISKEKFITEDLLRSNAELDDFAYITSHDLREPLRAIRNHIDFLFEDHAKDINEEAMKRFIRIKDLAAHMNDLLESLLYFSRAGKADLVYVEIDLNLELKKILSSLEDMIKEYNVEIIVNDLPTTVCDSVRIGEVYRNLICNAIKYNDKEKPVIEIGITTRSFLRDQSAQDFDISDNDIIFYVKDNGIGIDRKHFKSIFKMFKRLHGNEGKYGGGTGFGLSFIKKIVSKHRGKIWLDSEPGQWTCFYFTLPHKEVNKHGTEN